MLAAQGLAFDASDDKERKGGLDNYVQYWREVYSREPHTTPPAASAK